MNEQEYLKEIGVLPEASRESVRGYLVGLALSAALSLASYAAAVRDTLPRPALLGLLMILALAQFFAQSAYFLHIRRAEGPGRDRFLAYCSFSAIVAIVVIGSLWVMTHLNHRMISPEAQMEYMQTH